MSPFEVLRTQNWAQMKVAAILQTSCVWGFFLSVNWCYPLMITPLTTLFYAISSARGSAAHPRLVLWVVRCGEQNVTVRQNSHSGERISNGGGWRGGDVEFNNHNNDNKSKSSLTWLHARFRPSTVLAQWRNFHFKAATFANFPPLSEWWNVYPLPQVISSPPLSPSPLFPPSRHPCHPLFPPSQTWGPVAASWFINVYVFWSAGQKGLACDP